MGERKRERERAFRCRRVHALGGAEGDAADMGCRRRGKRKKVARDGL